MLRRKLWLMMVGLIVLGVMGLGYSDELEPNTVSPLVLEDFEGDLSAWTVVSDQTSSLGIVDDPTDPNNHVLQVTPGLLDLAYPLVVAPDAQQTLAFRLAYDGDPNLVDNNYAITVGDGAGASWGNQFAILRMGMGQKLDYRDGGSYKTLLQTTEPLTWYNVILDLDMAAMKYDIYLNNELVVVDAGFRSQDLNGIQSVRIRQGKTGDFIGLIDDLVMGVAVPEPKQGWPVQCVQLAEGQEIIVDGIVTAEEYAGAQAIIINQNTAAARDPYNLSYVHTMFNGEQVLASDMNDFNGTYYVMWDPNYLYLAATVQDDSVKILAPGARPNAADAFQFNLAENPYVQDKGTIYIPTIVASDSRGEPNALNVFGKTFNQNDVFIEDTEYAGSLDDVNQDWTVEIKIPWATLTAGFSDPASFVVESGIELGFNIVVIDNDPDASGEFVSNIFAMMHSAIPWKLANDKNLESLVLIDSQD